MIIFQYPARKVYIIYPIDRIKISEVRFCKTMEETSSFFWSNFGWLGLGTKPLDLGQQNIMVWIKILVL